MGITIQEALQLPIMKKAKLVAGKEGIRNTIKWVTIVEVLVPDDIDRLQEGELLITTGFGVMESDEKREVFHLLLSMKKLSGIALYTGFRLPEVPESFIEIANKHDMPLLEISPEINFSMITKEILEQIVNSQMKLLEYSHSIHEKFTRLVLCSQGLLPITQTLSRLIQGSVIVINDLSEIAQHCLIHHTLSVSGAECITIREDVIRLQELLSRCTLRSNESFVSHKQDYVIHIQPIVASQDHYGFIVSMKESEKWEKLDSIAIEHAATVYAIEILKLKAVQETRIRLQGDYLEELLNESFINQSQAFKRGKTLGLDLTLKHAVIRFQFASIQRATIAVQLFDQLMKLKNRQTVIKKKQDTLIVLAEVKNDKFNSNKQDSLQLAQAIHDKWERLFPQDVIKIGIGRVYSDLQELPKSAREAEYSIHFSDLLLESKTMVHYDDLGHYHILIQMVEAGMDLRDFYENLLGPLFSLQGDALLRTLEVYLHHKNMQIAADEIFVHRQTLRYRLTQIEKLTSLDLKSPDDQMKLQLAIMAYKLDRLKNPTKFEKIHKS